MLNRVMTKDNIGVAVLLELRKEMMEQSGLTLNSFCRLLCVCLSSYIVLIVFCTKKKKACLLVYFSRETIAWNGEAAAAGCKCPHALGP